MAIHEKAPPGGSGRASKMHTIEDGTQENDNTPPQSCAKQRQTILAYLQQGNRLTTLHAREELGIMHPAARVMELRADGWNIVTHNQSEYDASGTRHLVAEYVLLSGSEEAHG